MVFIGLASKRAPQSFSRGIDSRLSGATYDLAATRATDGGPES